MSLKKIGNKKINLKQSNFILMKNIFQNSESIHLLSSVLNKQSKR